MSIPLNVLECEAVTAGILTDRHGRVGAEPADALHPVTQHLKQGRAASDGAGGRGGGAERNLTETRSRSLFVYWDVRGLRLQRLICAHNEQVRWSDS